ncbi:flagellar basal body rod protein FlgB [Gammaproteobacteria bacterium]|jgi:flagellar basal-body rod protein FlgB|nr:flagellar basal body rod protein FlgB [Betaproteobacteria bacterium]MDB3909423.1 flagellar basal body rod protein FlgB [Gammaproteobacteria bacterium]MDC3196116.1 flagellar basal body rod protein FlgB [Gammaproteobacteria bacterium]
MSILNKYESYLGFSQSALNIKARRVQVISENIINASTPNYRAKDINFEKILGDRINQEGSNNHSTVHAQLSSREIQASTFYRVPLSPSVDNNTVEIGVEQAKFGQATSDYQASLQFFEGKVSSLFKAIRGE